MSVQRFSSRVSETEVINEKFRYLHLELMEPKILEFIAGQYILLDVPGDEKKRNYSIASSPSINHAIDLLVDISPQGKGTQYIAALKPGDPVNFFAPGGQFCVAQQDAEVGKKEQALVFVATGSGITPLRSMILDQLQNKKDTRPIVLYWGLRYEQDVFWLQEFEELQDTHPNFQLHLVLSKAGPEWPLCRGRVTDCLSIHPMVEYAGYYLCGNARMIEDTQQLLLSKGIAEEHIHREKFY